MLEQAGAGGFSAVTVRRVETFREVLHLLYKDTPVSSRSPLWFGLAAAVLIILAGTGFAGKGWWSHAGPVSRSGL